VLIVLLAFSVLAGLYGLFEYKRRQKSSGQGTRRLRSQPRSGAA
jgi:hypothetical protein